MDKWESVIAERRMVKVQIDRSFLIEILNSVSPPQQELMRLPVIPGLPKGARVLFVREQVELDGFVAMIGHPPTEAEYVVYRIMKA